MKTLNTLAIAAACGAMAFTLPATAADKFSVKAGGRIQLDAAYVNSDDQLLQNESASEFRRVRTFLKGQGFGFLDYKVQIDFDEAGQIGFEDLYIRMKTGKTSKIWLGHFHQPFGMEELTSSKYTDFMERSMASQVMDLGKKRSIGYSWHSNQVWMMASMFSQEATNADGRELVGAAGRVAFNPVKTDITALHFGLSLGSQGSGAYRGARYRTNYHVMSDRIDQRQAAGDFDGGPTQVALEFAGAFGPFAVKTEYLSQSADLVAGGDYDVDGAYVNLTYAIGSYNQAKHYSIKNGGTFGRIKAKNQWLVGARIDMLSTEATSLGIDTESTSFTLGGTYILNPYTRFKAEVVFAETEENDVDVQDDTVFQVRTQIDF